MLSSPSLSPSVRIHHYPIPDRLAPYIETAEARNLVGAVGLRWHLVPTGCVGFGLSVDDPASNFELESSDFESVLKGLLPRALGTWCAQPNVSIGVTMTPRAMMLLPMEAIDFGFGLWAHSRDIFSRERSASLYRHVRDAPTLDAKMQALLQWLEQLLFDGRPAHGRRLAMGEVATLMRRFDSPNLADAARRVGVSQRQFERDFQRYLGATPRRYAQVAKVQQMAQRVWQGHSLADTAAALGFADQAHMTRLVHDVTGMPPATLLKRARASPFAHATGTTRTLRLTHV
jgi:AraC-like DNA-binding protein